ncbi:glutamate receptor ionotropic, kainate 2-like [Parasteatoda tepidariorum]|uniref:glutamate receptor ionotropic, kainate 2-like n=1 Tax=Parasteatoda tepidariorum TaxID=114398 RepID=UPI0039BCC6FB
MNLIGIVLGAVFLFALESTALPAVIKLGGLFDTEDEEQELAFKIAVEIFNNNTKRRSRPRLEAQVKRIATGDIFDATQKVCSLLETGVAAIFGPQDRLTSLHVASICDEFEVPHIETRWDRAQKRDDLSINLHPSPNVLSDMYVAMIKHMGWKNFTLLYEENEGFLRLQNFLKGAQGNDSNVQIYKFEEDIPYRSTFWEIKKDIQKLKLKNQKIILDVGRKNLYDVLKQAQQVGMLTENEQYLITCLDLHTIDLSDFKYGKSNLTGFHLIQDNSNDYQSLVHRMSQNPYFYHRGLVFGIRTETALMFDAVRMFVVALQDLDVGKEVKNFPAISCKSGLSKGTDGTSLINYMKSSKMIGTTGIIAFDGQGIRSAFQMDLMILQEKGLFKFGEILPGLAVNITQNVATEEPLENKKFTVTTIKGDPYVMLKNSSDPLIGNNRFEGFCIDLIERLSEVLHFSYEIKLVDDGDYGNKFPNGSWSGMIGEVMRGEAHMAVAGLSINHKREKAVDFTMPFMNTGISILYKKPTTKVTSLFSFLSPFSTEVWIYLMGTYFLVSIVSFLIGRLTPYEWINPHPCRQDDIVVENVFNVRNTCWLMTGSLMQQGSDLIPTAFSTRTVASFWNFFTLIMVSSYTANLAAFLTVERVIYPFYSAEDLSKQSKIKYGCIDSGTTRSFFEESTIPTYQNMWKAMISDENNLVVNNDAGKELVNKRNGLYAFMMESATIEYVTERECSLAQIGGLLDNKGYGIATKKGNRELSDWLSSGILRLQEKGDLQILKERWWKQKGGGKCSDPSKQGSSAVRELTLGNVGGVFVVLIFGLGAATLIAFLEFRWRSAHWENPNKESFWTRTKKEIKFALSFDRTTKPVPRLRKSTSRGTSTKDNSRASSRGTSRSTS